mmetsp:Transcript_32144/g.67576  ORF Transcript_32144/g.67576 Transcript_32144/m.67576 type:complete len:200 (+) Transcript_32144:207-806(+)
MDLSRLTLVNPTSLALPTPRKAFVGTWTLHALPSTLAAPAVLSRPMGDLASLSTITPMLLLQSTGKLMQKTMLNVLPKSRWRSMPVAQFRPPSTRTLSKVSSEARYLMTKRLAGAQTMSPLLSDGELRTEKSIGSSATVGAPIGEKEDFSGFLLETIFWELKPELLGRCLANGPRRMCHALRMERHVEERPMISMARRK